MTLTKTRNGTSKFRGVSWAEDHNKWRASITRNGMRTHLGYFTSETKASQAYKRAAKGE